MAKNKLLITAGVKSCLKEAIDQAVLIEHRQAEVDKATEAYVQAIGHTVEAASESLKGQIPIDEIRYLTIAESFVDLVSWRLMVGEADDRTYKPLSGICVAPGNLSKDIDKISEILDFMVVGSTTNDDPQLCIEFYHERSACVVQVNMQRQEYSMPIEKVPPELACAITAMNKYFESIAMF